MDQEEIGPSARKGRPKGSKNKPKRGRPKNSQPKKPSLKSKQKRSPKGFLRLTNNTEDELDQALNFHLNDDKFTEAGYNTSTDKIINEEPVDPSFYYRGSTHVPIAGAQYKFTADMVSELRRCKEDIIYFAENFFYIIALDRGKEKIQLYEAQKRVLRSFVADRNVIVCSSRQIGKALSLDTPILTVSGWKTLETIQVGDMVFGSNGQPTTVTNVHDIMTNRPCYKVITDSGEILVADESHEWFTQHRTERQKNLKGSVKTTKEIFDTLKCSGSNEPAHRIEMSLQGVIREETILPIDPYVLGLWLGDGAKEAGWITVGDRDLPHILSVLNENGQFNKISTRRYSYTNATYVTLSTINTPHKTSLHSLLKKHNLYKNKHIPEEYFLASREQRLELLRGLMDSDGYIAKNGLAVFYNSDESLHKDVFRLITELGYKTSISTKQAKLNGVPKKLSYGINFKPREYVVTIPFKKDRIKIESSIHNPLKRSQYHYIVDVTPCKSVPVRCITVDAPDSLYLAGKTLIPTHNSTMLTVFSLWMVCFHDDYRAAIVANKETTAINIFKRIRMAYEQLPNYIKPGVKDYGKTGMTLGNDSSIVVSTTTATSIRGDSLNCVLLDEAAHIEPHLIEEFWSSVIPTVSSGKKSKILVVSTPKGVGNKFYEIYSGAESGKLKTWVPQRIDWWDFPGRDEAWKQTQIELLGSEEKFHQEFDNTFLDDAASALGAQVLEKFKREKKPPIWVSDDGEYQVFEYPNSERLYVMGVDVSEGIGRAASVAQILDVTDLQNIIQVAVYGSAKIEPYHFANKLNTIGSSWGNCPMLIERNNCGAQVIDALYHKHQYEKIVSYSKVSEKDRYNKTRNMGVLSHNNIRFDGIQNMRYWINHLDAVRINDTNTISEFETFVKFPNGVFRKKSDNFFDDRIMALVWGLFILESEICQQYFEIIDFDTQHKPLMIKHNGYWENLSENYNLKDLSITPKVIARPESYVEQNSPTATGRSVLSTLNIEEIYEDDVDDLLSQGYSFFSP